MHSKKDLQKVVLVVGNPLVPSDSMPLRILPLLQKLCPDINFQPFEPTRMDIPQNTRLVFIDTLQGAKEIIHFHNLGELAPSNASYSLHDFDLAGQLLVLSKFGLIGQVSIIGIPCKGEKEKIAKKVAAILRHIFRNPKNSKPKK